VLYVTNEKLLKLGDLDASMYRLIAAQFFGLKSLGRNRSLRRLP